MSRGFDGFEIDDFRSSDFVSDRGVSRSPLSDWSKWTEIHNIHREEERADRLERESKNRSERDRPSRAREQRVRTFLSQRVRARYTDRNKTYSLRDSEIHTLSEVGKFRVVATREAATKGVKGKQKVAIIVRGGPGTGKSVIAMNLLGDFSRMGLNAHYVTGSRAFTSTIREIVGTRGAAQVRYFNSYMGADVNVIDVMIADEAHRIRETSNNRFTPKLKQSKLSQIQELLKASRTAVFFIDDNQIVRPGEIGSTEYIKAEAEKLHCEVCEFELEAQFRCAGSDAFVSWVNNTLGIQRTPHVMWNEADDFDFKIMPTPQALEDAIREKLGKKSTARLTAGFCWPWSNPKSDGTLVGDVVIDDYIRPWNAKSDSGSLALGIPKESLWAYDADGVNQIGCVYTAQGFEFDYVGVIFGPDLVYLPEVADWKGDKAKSFDTVVKRSGDRFTQMVKNTYRVLLTRGMKGCYVHFMDKNTENFFRSRMEHSGKG